MDKALYNKTKCELSRNYWILIILLSAVVFQGCREKPKEIKILFTGDILLARNVEVEIKSRRQFPWTNMESLFKSEDLVMGNLEGAVGKPDNKLISDSAAPIFKVPKSNITLLSQAGFKIISVENNHSLDNGDSGKTETINELIKTNISPVFKDNSPQFFTIRGVTVAIVAINLIPSHDKTCQQIPSIEIRQKLRVAKNLSNMVIVFIHWGSELFEWPNQNQRNAAKWLIENGADLIIGCHPHVIQQPEMIDGKPVFFSLGNHLFDQKDPVTKEGLMIQCSINNGSFECKGILTHTGRNSFFPEVIGDTDYSFPSVPLHNTLNISGITLRQVLTDEKGRIIIEASSNGKTLWQTLPMDIISISKGKLDGKNEYLFTLERHFSNMDDDIGIRPYVYSVTKTGLISRWRGSALAWPLLDADVLPGNNQILCALHRGDSFINLNPNTNKTHIAAYKWDGFGFKGDDDSSAYLSCEKYYNLK